MKVIKYKVEIEENDELNGLLKNPQIYYGSIKKEIIKLFRKNEKKLNYETLKDLILSYSFKQKIKEAYKIFEGKNFRKEFKTLYSKDLKVYYYSFNNRKIEIKEIVIEMPKETYYFYSKKDLVTGKKEVFFILPNEDL